MSRRGVAPEDELSRRERQIMDVLLRRHEATASMVREEISDPPSYDAVRTTLRILTEKGYAVRRNDGARYAYAPAIDFETARNHALSHLVRTFFEGSAARAALALLKQSDVELDERALDRLEETISRADEAPATAPRRKNGAGGRR